MPSENNETVDAIRADLEATRAVFHALLDAWAEEDFPRRSHNPGWTNGEILAHMLFGFIVAIVLLPLVRGWGRLPQASSRPFAWLLNALTGPFNWFNALGARMQGKVFTRALIGDLYDRVLDTLLDRIAVLDEEEWARGMYFPAHWDPNFSDYMTVKQVLQYPIKHFYFHLTQLALR